MSEEEYITNPEAKAGICSSCEKKTDTVLVRKKFVYPWPGGSVIRKAQGFCDNCHDIYQFWDGEINNIAPGGCDMFQRISIEEHRDDELDRKWREQQEKKGK